MTSNISSIDTPENANYTSFIGFQNLGPKILTTGTYADAKFESMTDGLPFSMNSTVTFEPTYFEFNRPSVTRYWQNDSWTSMLGTDFIYSKPSAQAVLQKQAQFGSGFFIDTNFTFSSHLELNAAQNILFGSFYNSQITL